MILVLAVFVTARHSSPYNGNRISTETVSFIIAVSTRCHSVHRSGRKGSSMACGLEKGFAPNMCPCHSLCAVLSAAVFLMEARNYEGSIYFEFKAIVSPFLWHAFVRSSPEEAIWSKRDNLDKTSEATVHEELLPFGQRRGASWTVSSAVSYRPTCETTSPPS